MKKLDLFIPSERDTQIPVSITEAEGKGGLLILVHGFKAERNENGRFSDVAEFASEHGLYSIRMDLPGNGESKEPFENYSLESSLQDVENCYRYMKDHYEIDEDLLFLLGYSMGGRIISLFRERHPEFKHLIFWAGCNRKYTAEDRFLEQDLGKLKEEGDRQGICTFYDIFTGEMNRMSPQFVHDLLEKDALNCLKDFPGKALILQGDRDQTIEVENGQWIYDSLFSAQERRLVMIHGADHGFGLWDGRTEDNEKLLKITNGFIEECIRFHRCSLLKTEKQ